MTESRAAGKIPAALYIGDTMTVEEARRIVFSVTNGVAMRIMYRAHERREVFKLVRIVYRGRTRGLSAWHVSRDEAWIRAARNLKRKQK